MRTSLRPDLPPLPERMKALPLDARGYPVPWVVAWIDGVPDFRVIGPEKIRTAAKQKRCWLCGEPLDRWKAFGWEGAFVIGPMCALNRTTAEPPSHRECALFAVQACPFLTRPNAERRSANLPTEASDPAGVMISRNPGVILIWITRSWKWYSVANGTLCEVGEPRKTLWFAEGREAPREKIEESIESGLPLLLGEAPSDPDELSEGLTWIAERLEATWKLLPGSRTDTRSASKIVLEALVKAHGEALKASGALT